MVWSRYFQRPPLRAMALEMEALLLRVLTDTSGDAGEDEKHIVTYLVNTLHRANIVKPNDLGFLCSAGGGVPQRVFDSLDPDMPEPSKKLLGKACAG